MSTETGDVHTPGGSIFKRRRQLSLPRTWELDCDWLFTPTGEALHPEPQTCKGRPAAEITGFLEGYFRRRFLGTSTAVRGGSQA